MNGSESALLFPLAAMLIVALAILYIRLSRAFALQILLLLALGGYIVVAALGYSLIGHVLSEKAAPPVQVGFIVGAAVAMLVTLLSPVQRASLKVQVAKHLFAHRYDYRTEWLRFTTTLGRPAEGDAALDRRVVKAVADITESPAGLLLGVDETGLVPRAHWRWEGGLPSASGGAALTRYLETTGRIIELDALRRADPKLEQEAALVPEWMIVDSRVWALVPLVHFDQLQGVALLARPLAARALDWEDFDLLRVVGRQAGSYLAEASGQEALSDSRRFDEFNRRFAFIMHDIKNLVSQLSLVARNAERHADNPAFRADMVATLQSSVGKMNDLLARLSQHNKARPEEPRPVSAVRLVSAVAAPRRGQHAIVTQVAGEPMMLADPARLEQALSHLVQNAIEASPADEPVVISVREDGAEIVIEVRDRGCGMSQEFVRSGLFRPFASTKDGGFGVGAFEARSLVAAMNGRIAVESREGQGTVFTITLPAAAAAHPIHTPEFQ